MRRFSVLLVLLTLGFAAPLTAQAPERTGYSEPTAPAGMTAAPAVQQPGAATGAQSPAFAERAQQARTMEAYWHVFIAFAVTLLLLFGYAISIGRRWAALEREVLLMRRETGSV